ncbi:MAG: di-trans,poly-cis-decaprenylcistransferase [Candidatus Verstraetearchaeota archaeon]|jgi:tritrans,polycis-undecaprenyl-diphosphate synthase [geranylgeranyl-diphosphate specific]|nr:di-trans,poly-cis-decaprenylcistransferase [Candidatus Verstraetearchaeota archaeon]
MINWIKSFILKYIYNYYEKRLLNEVKKGKMPEHVGLILDGNRRWAIEMGFSPEKGHEYGYEKLKEVLKWCWELGINIVTIYVLSTENLYRSKEELDHLFKLAKKGFKEILESPEISKYEVRIKAIGRLEVLDKELIDLIKKVEEKTKDYSKNKLYIAIAYGGRAEIVDATKKIVEAVIKGELSINDINEEIFSKYLYTQGDKDPDLIIRTSGEERLSGFLLWQSAYSELYFMDVYWPEIRKIDLLRAIRTYQKRHRRFGR